MLQATVEIEGLDRLLHTMGNTSILASELHTAELASLKVVKEKAKDNAASFSNVLPSSVRSDIDSGGLSGIIGSVAKTGLSIEVGRKRGEMPSFESIERWITHRGIGAAQTIRGRRYLRPRKHSAQASQLHDDAVGIAFKIRDSGTKALPFIIPAAAQGKDKVTELFNGAIERAVKKWAGKS